MSFVGTLRHALKEGLRVSFEEHEDFGPDNIEIKVTKYLPNKKFRSKSQVVSGQILSAALNLDGVLDLALTVAINEVTA